MNKAESTIRGLLALADIEINGSSPRDIQVRDAEFYQRVLSGGPLGMGESYMDGLWDCEALDELIYQLLRADLEHSLPDLVEELASAKSAVQQDCRLGNLNSLSLRFRDLRLRSRRGRGLLLILLCKPLEGAHRKDQDDGECVKTQSL